MVTTMQKQSRRCLSYTLELRGGGPAACWVGDRSTAQFVQTFDLTETAVRALGNTGTDLRGRVADTGER